MAEDTYAGDEWWPYETAETYHGDYDLEQGWHDEEFELIEEFTEHDTLAMMAAEGVDLDDEESMEYAADIIQAEHEAYLTRNFAAYKGFKGFKGKGKNAPRQFHVQGQLSLSERQQKIAQLKEKTTCRRCGQVGHWSNDPTCPKGKGKGKSKSSSSSSTSAGPGKGGKKDGSNRTVYFSVRSNVEEDDNPPQVYMAMRYNKVPPPSSLEDGTTISSPSSTPWSMVEAEQRLQEASNELVLTQEDLDMAMLREALGGHLPQDEPPPQALQQEAANPEHRGLGSVFRGISSLFGGHQPAYPLPGDFQDMPRMDMDLEAEMSGQFAIEDRFPQYFAEEDAAQKRRDERADLSVTSHQMAKDQAEKAKQDACRHQNTTTSGSNAYYFRKTCKDCNKILEKTKRTSEHTTSSSTTDKPKSSCPHHNVSWHGTNGHRWKQTCKDCGDVKTGPVAKKDAEETGTSSQTRAMPRVYTGTMNISNVGIMMHLFEVAMKMKEDHFAGPDGELPIDEIISALEVSISVANRRPAPFADTATTTSKTASKKSMACTMTPNGGTLEDKLNAEGTQIVNFGSYKNATFHRAWKDQAYVKWCLDHTTPSSSPGQKKLAGYFREMKANHMPTEDTPSPTAYMAARKKPDGSENDLLAILDTGCNATCHGASWLQAYYKATGSEPPPLEPVSGGGMRGIGGSMKLSGQRTLELSFELENGNFARGTMTSFEIEDSDAPLLLSIGTQRQLGFVIDLNKKTVDSEVLGSQVKLGEIAEPYYKNDHITENDLTKKEYDGAPQVPEPQEEDIQLTPEVHLAFDEITSKKTFTKGQRKHFVSEVKEVQNADKHMWGTLRTKLNRPKILPKGCRTFLFEVFAGTALLSMMAAEAGYAVSQPCDILLDGSNLLNASERAKIEAVIDSDDPYCVSFSPVCGPWSPLQQLSVAKDPSYAQKLGLQDELEHTYSKYAFPAEFSLEEEQPFGTLDRIYNPEDEAIVPLPPRLDEVELHQEESRDELAGCSSQDHLRRQEWKKLPLAKRVAVRRLQQMTGHASSSAMARMLKLAKADPEVLSRLKHFRCETCQHLKKPEPTPVVKPPRLANRGQLASFMQSQGVHIRYAGTEAAHQIGRAERQGSILKEVIHRTVDVQNPFRNLLQLQQSQMLHHKPHKNLTFRHHLDYHSQQNHQKIDADLLKFPSKNLKCLSMCPLLHHLETSNGMTFKICLMIYTSLVMLKLDRDINLLKSLMANVIRLLQLHPWR
ncbi:unnamed protein product [Durusdinium trenchii]|uniref:CCHC-type domain-containing protein n=1 Tax=Durusdinium trenchii TaxID=1381693 RepID=A0ABP0NMP1_9DINO